MTMLNTQAFFPQFAKSQVYLNQVLSLFEAYQHEVDVLSLDCFDTLIWRNVDTYQDMFYALQEKPTFKTMGLTALQRMMYEDKARGGAYFKKQTSEVNLFDIYGYINNDLSHNELEALIQEEVQTEIAHSFAQSIIVELMRLAHKKNKKIIIVSDTYYSQQQLYYLLAKKLPLDVLNSIDKIYCSCEYDLSKSQGLFKHILNERLISAKSILHIGDNPIADKTALQSLEIQAFQLLHGNADFDQQQNMRTWASVFIDASIRYQKPLYHPFKAMVASGDFNKNVTERLIGYASVGPIMYAFGCFIKQEIANLKALGKPIRILFLMRDGYLPAKTCEILMPNEKHTLARISRFVTYAASFTNQASIENYLAEVVHSKQFHDICNQLLLPKGISDALITQAEKSDDVVLAFIKMITEPSILQTILSASSHYRERLFNYFREKAGIKEGDHIILIDLGYNATTQEKLTPILRSEFKAEVTGLYLISLPSSKKNHKKGLIDITNYDERLLTMLVRYIAVFEKICTAPENSVVDYDNEANPILLETSVSQLQHDKINFLQSQTLKFIHEVDDFIKSTGLSFELPILRDCAAIELCRLIYLPTALEIDYLKCLQFDFNLGTSTLLEVFNIEKGITGLRQQSLFFMEKNPKKIRTNYPAELRTASLELSFLLMSMERYKGKITANDLSLRREKLPIILASTYEATKDSIFALPTFDGYYAALIPLSSGKFQIAIQFGEVYKWIEIESIHTLPASAVYSPMSSELSQEMSEFAIFESMIKRDTQLYECTTNAGFLAFLPPPDLSLHHKVLRVIFRPIVRRNIQ